MDYDANVSLHNSHFRRINREYSKDILKFCFENLLKFQTNLIQISKNFLPECHWRWNFKQCLSKDSNLTAKSKSEILSANVTATIFWDSNGMLLIDFLESRQTIADYNLLWNNTRKITYSFNRKNSGKIPHIQLTLQNLIWISCVNIVVKFYLVLPII